MPGGLPPDATFGDVVIYYGVLTIGLLLALALLALLSESLIKVVRALGSAFVALPSVAIPFCEHIEDALCDLGGKALGVTGSGWPAIRALLDLVLFLGLAGTEFYFFATRVGGMLGVPVPYSLSALGVVLGITFTAATAVVAITWKEEHDKIAARGGNRKTLRWITIAAWLVIIDAILLGIWTTEVVFVGRNDVAVGALFLIVLTCLVCVAVGLTINGAVKGAVVLAGLLLYALWLPFYLIATIFYFTSELTARIVAIAEAILASPRELGRTVWNATPQGKTQPIGPRQELPLINAHIVRPQFRRTPPPAAAFAPAVPPTPVVPPAAPTVPANGKGPEAIVEVAPAAPPPSSSSGSGSVPPLPPPSVQP